MMEIYVSVDVETDGPIPGKNSMLSLGAVAFVINEEDYSQYSTFSVNMDTAEGAEPNAKTMQWWEMNPEAWAHARTACVHPQEAMESFLAWLKSLPGKPVFVGYPAGFDFMFTYWYLIRYVGTSPFSFSGIDMKTMAMTLLGSNYRDINKKVLRSRWPPKQKHTHVALDDAIEQGEIFCKMMLEARKGGDL